MIIYPDSSNTKISFGHLYHPIEIPLYTLVFASVLDAMKEVEGSYPDENGNQLNAYVISREEINTIDPNDVRLTIQPRGELPSVIDVFNNHRISINFSLHIPMDSVLASLMEYPLSSGVYYVRVEGFFVLFRFNSLRIY